MHHRLPTGKMQFTAPHPCPHCKRIFDQSSEHDHFLMCENSSNNKEKRIEQLGETMKTLHTPPSLIKVILHHVSTYYKISPTDTSESPQHILSEELHFCIKKQNEIGWGQFIRGHISKDFQKTMHKHYRLNNQGRSYTGKIWARKVIKSLLDIHIDEWIKYCEAIHTPSLGLKKSSPAHATMITLIKKYYQQSRQLPKNKKNGSLERLNNFSIGM